MRINKFIAASSKYSRRKADELILEGRVKVNNKTTKTLGIDIDPQVDKVKINNKELKGNIEYVYFLLNKPAGFVCTRSDELGRKTIMDLLPPIKNLKPAGRLDKDTEGLIILSNDGNFINRITHPKFECQKKYYAKITSELTNKNKKSLEKGVKIERRITSPSKIKILKSSPKETELHITIHEGRKRQIRKMFALIGHTVKYLQRIKIGNLSDNCLKKGKFRPLSPKEIYDF
ncbi:pseudouridine synthase [Candidatus Peregrinibacteria bacterium]|nr:pseudouridine synthase [Candidatus Peregrinibacteria bacterium]